MRVEQVIGEPLRFRVQSESNPRRWYLVDLEFFDNNGCCDCPEFQYRQQPLLLDDYQSTVKRRCKHVIAAREYFLDCWLKMLSAERKRIRK